MDKNNKSFLMIILILMVVSGCIIYYMFMKPEQFIVSNEIESFETPTLPTDTDTPKRIDNVVAPNICPPAAPLIPASILSRYFGVGFNVIQIQASNQNSSQQTLQNPNQQSYYMIEHIPTTTTGTAGGMYSISSDGRLTIKVQNSQDPTQWWSLNKLTDSKDETNYYIVQPFTLSTFSLQYENGNIAIRPYTMPGFESQRWLTSQIKITRGIPVLNYSPGSLFTAEFDPYSSSSSITTDSLTDSNSKQVSDVVNAVKAGIQQYLAQAGQNTGQVTASALGNKEMPLSVNLNIGGASGSGVSSFANIDGTTTNNDILSYLDKYESNSIPNNNTSYLPISSTNNTGCKLINPNDYTSNRVSSCNCKL